MLVSLNEAHSVCQRRRYKGLCVCVCVCVYLHILEHNGSVCLLFLVYSTDNIQIFTELKWRIGSTMSASSVLNQAL